MHSQWELRRDSRIFHLLLIDLFFLSAFIYNTVLNCMLSILQAKRNALTIFGLMIAGTWLICLDMGMTLDDVYSLLLYTQSFVLFWRCWTLLNVIDWKWILIICLISTGLACYANFIEMLKLYYNISFVFRPDLFKL